MEIKFANRTVGDGHPCFVTFEIGPTHNGFDSAKRLIDHAAKAGADAVKFQIIDPDRLVADHSIMFEYDILIDKDTGETETVQEPLYDLIKRRSLSDGEWKDLKKYADSIGMVFFATIGFPEEIALLEEIGCESIKIASSDVNHHPLIRQVAKTGMCIQLDTGNSTLGEIEAAVDIIRSEGNENIIIHHCPSGYPARLDGINLNIITTLKQLFDYPIAFSDHTPGWEMDIAAITLGANLVEKTITEDRATRSVEHIFSLEPDQMVKFVSVVKNLQRVLGQKRRILQKAEIDKRTAMRRSIYLDENGKKGTKIEDLKISFRRPGYGISPVEYEKIGKFELKADLPAGHMLEITDLARS